MRIVAIDTTSNSGSLALHDNGLVEEVPIYSTEGFSKSIYVELRALLDRHAWSLSSVAVFAAASGPGSFTGVRVGLAAAKGLAEAIGARVAAVSNLKALAACGSTERRAVLIDARRSEVYAAMYDSALRELESEVVMPFDQWISSVKAPTEIISSGVISFRDAIPWNVPVIERTALAAAVAQVASMSVPVDPAAADANYVRRSDAELFWTET